MIVDHVLIQHYLEDVFNAIKHMDAPNAKGDFSNFFINVIEHFGD
jgi:hypothetical protein